jgi:hypothetical protein
MRRHLHSCDLFFANFFKRARLLSTLRCWATAARSSRHRQSVMQVRASLPHHPDPVAELLLQDVR